MTQAKHAGVTILVAEQLADELEGKLSRDEIEEVVEAHADDFADAKVPNFVSTFVARRAREDLEARIRQAEANGDQEHAGGRGTFVSGQVACGQR